MRCVFLRSMFVLFFFFNDTATTEIYTLSLHDALPIYLPVVLVDVHLPRQGGLQGLGHHASSPPCSPVLTDSRVSKRSLDRKSTRLNSSHANISYAVFCLKKKKNDYHSDTPTYVSNYHR